MVAYVRTSNSDHVIFKRYIENRRLAEYYMEWQIKVANLFIPEDVPVESHILTEKEFDKNYLPGLMKEFEYAHISPNTESMSKIRKSIVDAQEKVHNKGVNKCNLKIG